MIRLQTILFLAVALLLMQCNTARSAAGKTDPRIPVWADEFDYEGLPDPARWSYDVGDACDLPMGCGWGNNELQYYTSQRLENARVQNGKLIIEVHHEDYKTRKYTSARLHSKGKGDWLYGRIEVRAKVPAGVGAWAAIWMLPSGNAHGGWPRSGEIDIMEHVGYMPDSIIGNIHTLLSNGMHGTDKPGRYHQPAAKDEFHTFALDWSEEKLDFFVDGNKFYTYTKTGGVETWPFDQPFHLLLNFAVGGGWGGKHGIDDSIWPQRMEIDYVRVYQPSK